MEVETRISVQAMRGKFEQLPEDNSFPCVPSPAPRLSISSGRPRTSSLIFKDRDANCNRTKSGEKVKNLSDDERESVNKNTKHSPVSVFKTKSVISEFVSPMLTGSKVVKALSSKKHSVDNGKVRKPSSESQQFESSVETTPSRKISDSSASESKPSVVKRIPVFKPFNGVYTSEDKTPVKNEVKDSSTESQGKRERFFGHIRSRSHGNFMIKRDSSVERNFGLSGRGEGTGKSGNEGADFPLKNYRQKSSDNLYSFRDSKCSSPFEGKQKIVANVVKNMKNKERPKVLRKFSFSSKTEKDLKNKKEKAHPDTAKDATPSKSGLCMVPNTAKMEAIAKSTVNERRASVTGSSLCTGTVSVAKAVADIALEKSSAKSSEVKDGVQSSCDETSPPARPPRRRSATSGLSSHKKGMAPSPPTPLLVSENGAEKEASCLDSVPSNIVTSGHRLSPDFDGSRYQDSPNYSKSSDSLASPLSSDVSRENSPIMISQNSPPSQKSLFKSNVTLPDVNKLYPDTPYTVEETSLSKKGFKSELHLTQLGTSTRNSMMFENGSAEQDLEILPPGPPPKKPPRTFAYDIYRSGKESKSAEDVSLKADDRTDEKLENTVPVSGGPVYAIPQKKKKPENKLTAKAPVRSNSDLSKRDLVKPAVAPKPPHISNKVKRSSVVDPISSAEKCEETNMTSEFQRQAHIRYSLRRPKKPPPAPPPDSEMEGKFSSESVNSPNEKVLVKSSSVLNEDCASSDDNIDKGDYGNHLTESSNMKSSRYTSNCVYESVNSDSEDEDSPVPSIRITSHSSYNLHVPTTVEDNQPLSLGHCPVDALSSNLAGTYRKRSMSDETLHKGSRFGDEPIYAMPVFANSKGSRGHNRQRELHYMCSVLFTDEEEADAGRDGRGHTKNGDSGDGNKVKSSIISAWKREFRQSCRQVQNKIKKTVNR